MAHVTDYIKKQLEKEEPNWDEIEKLMAATYNYRRDFILQQGPIVKTVREIYPGLFYFQQINREFCRIKNEDLIYETFLDSLEEFQSKIIMYSDSSRKTFIEQKLEESRNAAKSRRKYIKTAGALLLLPSFFDINLKRFLIFNLEEKYEVVQKSFVIIGSKSPFKDCFNEDTQFIVFAEKTKLCETNDLRAAFFAYFAAHYIFNIEYSKECIAMIGIVEKLFLKIEPDTKEFTEKMKDVQTLLVGD